MKHYSHQTRFSDSSLYDEKCIHCGATDLVPGGWGRLEHPCPMMVCEMADRGCAHNKTCTKKWDGRAIEDCGYYKYFVYLDENFNGETNARDDS